MATEEAHDAEAPLLPAVHGGEAGAAFPSPSECVLQDKCFLAEGGRNVQQQRAVQRKLIIACCLCFVFMVVEIIGGWLADSVAIMSDAAHMLSDVSSFLVSIFAAWAAVQPSTTHYSFGYHRVEILGALVSVLTIWLVTGALVYEAVHRTINPVRVDGKLMFIISCAGVVFNLFIALALGVHTHGRIGGDGCSHHKAPGGHDAHSLEGHSHREVSSCSGPHAGSHSAGGNPHQHAQKPRQQLQQQHGSQQQQESQCYRGHGADAHHHKHIGQDHTHDQGGHSAHANGAAEPPAAVAAAAESDGADTTACGIAAHPPACRCIIEQHSSHEIEVRYELPLSAFQVPSPSSARLVSPAAGAVGAAAVGCGSGHSHSHVHDHGHGRGHGGGAAAARENINMRGAVLHVIGDLLQSIGVAIAGLLIWMHQDDARWYLADPVCTFVFSVLVLWTTRGILADIVQVLMERTPESVNLASLAQRMQAVDGIRDVHDLHVWNLSAGIPILTAHVHIGRDADAARVLQQLEAHVRRLGIDHSTIQICNVPKPGAPEEATAGKRSGTGADVLMS